VVRGEPERHGCRNRRARREAVHGAGGQGGHDVRAADGEGEVGVTGSARGRRIFWLGGRSHCLRN